MDNYIPGFYFQLSFNGVDAAFQEITGILKELNIEEVVFGWKTGLNIGSLPQLPVKIWY